MSDTVSDKILEVAQDPRRVSADGLSVEGQAIDDLIKADRYLASKSALRSSKPPFRLTHFKPPGAV